MELLDADALRRLAAQADKREAVAYLEQLLAVEPADETAHRALVLSHLARGRRDLSGRQALRWQQVLEELTGVGPTPDTRGVWEVMESKGAR